MKTIGLIGGTSWVSTVEYYKLINQLVNEKLGGANAATIILYSINFSDIRQLLETGNSYSSAERKVTGENFRYNTNSCQGRSGVCY